MIIYEGKAKIIHSTNNPDEVIQYFKDDTTAFNRRKFEVISGKGILNNYISSFIMQKLAANNISTHFIKRISDREQLVRKVQVIPIEVVVRNVIAGSLAKRLGIDEGKKLKESIVEFYYKKDELDDPFINDEHAELVLDIATKAELTLLREYAHGINRIMQTIFADTGLILVDFKLEFGRDSHGKILLADEISPDSCRLWSVATDGSVTRFDKDLFRRDLGDLVSGYKLVAKKLGIVIPPSI